MNIIICYDVKSNKTRKKISNLLEAYGLRVNYSVFELNIKESELFFIKSEISLMINNKKDKILFYRICKDCLSKSSSLGDAKTFSYSNTYI